MHLYSHLLIRFHCFCGTSIVFQRLYPHIPSRYSMFQLYPEWRNCAGHDTTASAISWCLYHLAKHPEYQQKARDEVDRVLSGRDSPDVLWSVTVCCLDFRYQYLLFNNTGYWWCKTGNWLKQGPNYKKILRLSYDVIITYDNRKSNMR